MRPVVVGEAPGRGTDPARPLRGDSGRRLARYAGLGGDVGELARRAERVNLVDRFPGGQGKGCRFPREDARRGARDLLALAPGRDLLLLGKRVAGALGWTDAEYLRWLPLKSCRLACVPHPSGVNRWWNDPANRRRARAFLCRALDVRRRPDPLGGGRAPVGP